MPDAITGRLRWYIKSATRTLVMSNQDRLEIARLTLNYLISIQTSENGAHALRRLEAEAGKSSDPDTFGTLYRVVFKEIEASVFSANNDESKLDIE